MPMRIISQGRQAYILAGYLLTRGKWSWHWSERYFVLTWNALHYFKRERRELYGKERGVFFLDDITANYQPEKLLIEIRSEPTGVTRLLKAPSEREYLAWSRAFQEAIAAKRTNRDGDGETLTHSHSHHTLQGTSLDSLHTITPRGGGINGSLEASQSSLGLGGNSNSNGGSQRPSLQGGLATHPFHHQQQHGGSSTTATPVTNTSQRQPQHGPSSTAAAVGNANKQKSGTSSNTLAPPIIYRARSTPPTSGGPSSLTLQPPSHSPDASMSGYMYSMSASPLPPSSPLMDHELHSAKSHTSLMSPASAGGNGHPIHKLRSSSMHEEVDVLRRFSVNDSNGPPIFERFGVHSRHLISSVSIDLPSSLGTHILARQLDWPSHLFLPYFQSGTNLHINLFDGAEASLSYSTLQQELRAGLQEGTKMLPVEQFGSGDANMSHKDERKIVISWRVIKSMQANQAMNTFTPSASSSPPTLSPSAIDYLHLSLPLIFIGILLSELSSSEMSRASRLIPVMMGFGFVLAAEMLRMQIIKLNPSRGVAQVNDVSSSSSSSPSSSLSSPISAFSSSFSDSFALEITFVSMIDPTTPHRDETLLPPPCESSSTPPPCASQSVTSSSSSSSSRKKKGILRRRANDLPAMAASIASEAPTKLLANEAGVGEFEMSEFDYNSDSGASRESSKVHNEKRRHRRKDGEHKAITPATSGANTENEPDGTPILAPLASSSSSSSAVSGSAPAPAPSSTTTRGHLRTTSSDLPTMSDSEVGPPSTTRASSGASTGLKRLGSSGRSDSEHADMFETDVESRFEDPDDAADEAEQELLHREALDALHQYEDTMPSPSPSPHENLAPWGGWMEDDVSQLKVRGPTFLDDKIKIPVGTPVFKLVHVDMFYTAQSNDNLVNVTARPGNWGFKYLEKREKKYKDLLADTDVDTSNDLRDPVSPLIVLNFLFPGPNCKNMNLVCYYIRRVRPGEELRKRKDVGVGVGDLNSLANSSGAPSRRGSKNGPISLSPPIASSALHIDTTKTRASPSPIPSPSVSYTPQQIARISAFDGLLRRFLDGPFGPRHNLTPNEQKELDEFRCSRFKIIPRIAAGPWLVRKGVGCTPVLLGKKVEVKYYRNPVKNYIEVVVDVSSSLVAGRILSLVKSAATALTIDLSFILQGESIDELPESLLGGVRILRCNLDALLEVEEHEKWLIDTWIKKQTEEGRW